MSISSRTRPTLPLNVWAVSFSQESFPEHLYQTGLLLLDTDSRARIKRFYHKADSYRCLLGRLLPCLLLKQHGVAPKEASFGRTSSGKPYVKSSLPERSVGFNVSHDSEYVVMAFQIGPASIGSHALNEDEGEDEPQTHDKNVHVNSIGIDVMKVALPKYEKTLGSFVQSISDTLTPLERRSLLEDSESNDALRRLYLVWTIKEAYTKALGLGLGFDFKRMEVDVHANRVSIDGNAPFGWEFIAFSLKSGSKDEYQVAVARGRDGGHSPGHVDMRGHLDETLGMPDWFTHYDAASFLEHVTEEQ